jgi:hypothetical protein
MPEIDLPPSNYRTVFKGPLGRRRDLLLGALVFSASTLLGVSQIASSQGFWLWSACTVFFAFMVGVCVTGLFPNFWFREGPPSQ